MTPPHWLLCRWSKWKLYTAHFTIKATYISGVSFTEPSPYDVSEERERRRCDVCGATQDRLVSR